MNAYYRVANDGSVLFENYNFKITGTVPRSIARKGTEAVEEYVTERIKSEKNAVEVRRLEHQRLTVSRRSVNHEVGIHYYGVDLRGVILEADHWNFEVRLDTPAEGVWKASNPGHKDLDDVNFDEQGNLTDTAILGACLVLIKLYKKALHQKKYRRSYELVERLKALDSNR